MVGPRLAQRWNTARAQVRVSQRQDWAWPNRCGQGQQAGKQQGTLRWASPAAMMDSACSADTRVSSLMPSMKKPRLGSSRNFRLPRRGSSRSFTTCMEGKYGHGAALAGHVQQEELCQGFQQAFHPPAGARQQSRREMMSQASPHSSYTLQVPLPPRRDRAAELCRLFCPGRKHRRSAWGQHEVQQACQAEAVAQAAHPWATLSTENRASTKLQSWVPAGSPVDAQMDYSSCNATWLGCSCQTASIKLDSPAHVSHDTSAKCCQWPRA